MSPTDMNESNDLFWALTKYAENVQEAVVQLDAVNPSTVSSPYGGAVRSFTVLQCNT